MKVFTLVLVLLMFTAASTFGDNTESYVATMNNALEPYGTVAGNDCHKLEIDLNGPWGYRAIPKGVSKAAPDEFTWAILRVNTLRLFLDLSHLEDKVGNNAIFSLHYIRNHQKGTSYVPDSPSVFFSATGPHGFMVEKVDLEKMKAIPVGTFATESEMGISLVERRGTTILFVDQQHADDFQEALTKAIIGCKAQ